MKNILKVLSIVLIILSLFWSCKMYQEISDPLASMTMSFDNDKKSLSVGEITLLNLSISKGQNSVAVKWDYDHSIIDIVGDNYTAIITGKKEGSTTVTASTKYTKATCMVTVSDNYVVEVTNPYVYVNTDYVEIKRNETLKISGSLFGGTQADINGFSWSVDKQNVCDISADGNYCFITGLQDGICKITCRHSKSSYPYSVLVNVSDDGTQRPYITSEKNVVNINLSSNPSEMFSVQLKNITSDMSNYESLFSYEVVNADGSNITNSPANIVSAGGLSCSLEGISVGQCVVRVTHPSATYPLDVLVNVTDNVSTSYISTSEPYFSVTSAYTNFSAILNNYDSEIDNSQFTWEFPENVSEYIEWYTCNGDDNYSGNTIYARGIKSGSFKVKISYPGIKTREVAFLVRDVVTEAASATTTISTSQNFIKLGIDDEDFNFSVLLSNCSVNDTYSLNWHIEQFPEDTTNTDVIQLTTSYGNVNSVSRSLVYHETAYGKITPISAGTAKIIITHPKAIYSCIIDVKVTHDTVEVVNNSYFSYYQTPLVKIKNGEQTNVSIYLTGSADKNATTWSVVSGNTITVEPNVLDCLITANGDGVTENIIEISNPKVDNPFRLTVITYDTEEELKDINCKLLYTDSSYIELNQNYTASCSLISSGYNEEELNITWTIISGDECIEIQEKNNSFCKIKGIKSGIAIITASNSDEKSITFTIRVKDERVIDIHEVCYLSCSTNVCYFNDVDVTKEFTVILNNLTADAALDLTYECTEPTAYEVFVSGNTFSITSLENDTEAQITVSHPLSENQIIIQLKTGKEYEFINQDFNIVCTSKDSLTIKLKDKDVPLYATIKNINGIDSSISSGFVFENQNPELIDITSFANNNVCFINPISSGVAQITVSHPDADISKDVLVIVENEDAALLPYLTTTTNEVYIVQGDYQTVTVELKNGVSSNSTWNWYSSEQNIANVVSNTGSTVLVSGLQPGTVQLTCSNSECINSLSIFVTVLDSSVISNKPYIFVEQDIYTIKKGDSISIDASLLGCEDTTANNYFVWSSNNPNTCIISSSQNTCYVKAVNAGLCYLTIKNSKYTDSYSKSVLIIVEDTYEEKCRIEINENVIKIKPDDSERQIRATLINGLPTDAQDFIWWCDDYNLITINSLTDSCIIKPTGKTGTTILHAKHPKAEKIFDIVIYISNYDTFNFPNKYINIELEKLYFLDMQIPATTDNYTIEYYSSNEELCCITGSNSVAVITGLSPGQVNLTANMISTIDNSIISTSEILVDVEYPSIDKPSISLGQSIITVEEGTSRLFSAILTNAEESDKYSLEWEIKNGAGDIYFNHSSDKQYTFTGPDCYVTFEKPGNDYIISVKHPLSGVSTDMLVIVEPAGEISVELETDLLQIDKDDGSVTIEANLLNSDDYSLIEWSAIKVGGKNIVSLSKVNSKSCTIVPREVGQTNVIARLPNGKYAQCTVIVKSSKSLTLEYGAVHVIPGYTTVVKYKATPPSSSVQWFLQYSDGSQTPYFTYEDDHQGNLYVTGNADYPYGEAGVITGYIMGADAANMPKLKVFVEYNIDLELRDTKTNSQKVQIINTNPDSSNVQTFDIVYFPTDLEIDISCGDESLFDFGTSTEELIEENHVTKMKKTISLIPRAEGATNIQVKAKLPGSNVPANKASKEVSLYYNAYYEEYNIVPSFDLGKEGAFSYYDSNAGENGKLYIADGETMLINVQITNENASGTITDIKWIKDTNKSKEFDKAEKYYENRVQARNIIFGDNRTSRDVMNTETIKSGAIVLQAENNSGTEQTVYRFGHMYDYYVDVNSSNFLDNEYYMITRDLVYWRGSTPYYAVGHEGKNVLTNCSTSAWVDECYLGKDDGHKRWRHYLYYSITYPFGTKYYMNREDIDDSGRSGTQYENFSWYSVNGFSYSKTIPYVITKSEFLSNNYLYQPYKELKGYAFTDCDHWGKDHHYSKKYCTFVLDQIRYDENFIQPTTCKNTEPIQKWNKIFIGNLEISYKTSTSSNNKVVIPVYYSKYECESYSYNSWYNTKYNGNNRSYFKSPDSDSIQIERAAFFSVTDDNDGIIDKENSILNYQIKPDTGVVTITIPNTNTMSGVKVKNYDSFNSSTNTYTIKNHSSVENGIGSGKIEFELPNEFNGTITVNGSGADLNTTNYIVAKDCFDDALDILISSKKPVVYKDYEFESEVESSNYSNFDSESLILYIGDGENVKGQIALPEWKSFTSAYFESEDSETLKDKNGKTAKDNTTVSVSFSDNIVSYQISHNQDYGFYRYKMSPTPSDSISIKTEGVKHVCNSFKDGLAFNSSVINTTTDIDGEYIGNIVAEYFSFKEGKTVQTIIPVVIQVRNNPCGNSAVLSTCFNLYSSIVFETNYTYGGKTISMSNGTWSYTGQVSTKSEAINAGINSNGYYMFVTDCSYTISGNTITFSCIKNTFFSLSSLFGKVSEEELSTTVTVTVDSTGENAYWTASNNEILNLVFGVTGNTLTLTR